MRLKTMKCPECHAALEQGASENEWVCPYCGVKVHVERDGSEARYWAQSEKEKHKTERDKARYAHEEAMADREAEKDAQGNKILFIWLGLTFALLLVPSLFDAVTSALTGALEVPVSSSEAEGLDAEDLQKRFEDVGFTDIEQMEMNDLEGFVSFFVDPGEVDHVTIDGDGDFSKSDHYPRDVKIRIYVHSEK